MKSEKEPLNSRREAAIICVLFVIFIAVVSAFVSGCATTVRPTPAPISAQASFDGGEQNSGILSSVPSGFVVTAHFRERYNAMIATYGGDFKPALVPDRGIAPIGDGKWLISKEAMVDFLTMNAWRRAGLEPTRK